MKISNNVTKVISALAVVAVVAVAFTVRNSEEKNTEVEDVLSETKDDVQVPIVQLPEPKPEIIPTKTVKRLYINGTRTLQIKGPVGPRSEKIANLIADLNKESETLPIFLIISSPGGSVISGGAIINAVQQSKAPVFTVCNMFCASMAAMIHQYGDKRYMLDRTLIMFHPAYTQAVGNVEAIKSYIDAVTRYINKIEVEVAARLGVSFEKYKSMTNHELWVDSDQAKELNVVEDIVHLQLRDELLANVQEDSLEEMQATTDRDLIWIYKGSM